MQTANQQLGSTTPVVCPDSSTTCLLTPTLLSSTISESLQQRAEQGRATAYAYLLKHFHRSVLPQFIAETNGNIAEASRLLGIHRETLTTYCLNAEIDYRALRGSNA